MTKQLHNKHFQATDTSVLSKQSNKAYLKSVIFVNIVKALAQYFILVAKGVSRFTIFYHWFPF